MNGRRGTRLRALSVCALCVCAIGGIAESASAVAPWGVPDGAYDIGSPTTRDIWVSPTGKDTNTGATRATAVKTITAAWNKIPKGQTLTGTGYRIKVTAGRYATAAVPNYWENALGTKQFPIIFESVDGAGQASIATVNMFNSRYVYFIGMKLTNPGGDIYHCEQCDHILLRDATVKSSQRGQETVKINQSKYVYIETSDIATAEDNAVDFVAVQYGHLLANRIHDAQDWCAYAKGGSAYIRVVGNEFYSCGVGGFTAGQGTGFQFMTKPWIQYEAYDVKVYNNIVHDSTGAAFGVNGGYNVLIANNTAYRVGSRSHVLEFVFGYHSCDGVTDPGCTSNRNAGGWGPVNDPDWDTATRIPNKNVFVYNNVILNPSGYKSQWQQLEVPGPYSNARQTSAGAPNPAKADDNLRLRGNVVSNGPANHPLGVDNSTGCASSNTGCNATQLKADNAFNKGAPQLVAPATQDFRPVPGGNLSTFTTYSVPAFTWTGLPSTVAAGALSNVVTKDRAGRDRGASSVAGAYLPEGSTPPPPPPPPVDPPPPPPPVDPPPPPPPVDPPPPPPPVDPPPPPPVDPPPTQTPGGYGQAYDIGTPTLREVWVDPVGGNDANSGSSRSQAFRTVSQAWRGIPQNTALTTGVRINLMPGRFSEDMVPNYWENRKGTYNAPIWFRSVDGPRTASISRVNLFNSSYVYFDSLKIEETGGDIVHCELCNHVLVRDSIVHSTQRGHEGMKVNQSQYIYLEGNDISTADDNAVDFVAVQYGHLLRNRIHDTTEGWCAYTKGGSAYIDVIGNEFDHCYEGGFTAGQGVGIEFMTTPWLQYEAYYIRVANNVIHDIYGAGLGVNGGLNVTMANNTLYRVGARSHLVEFVYGGHACDGDTAGCSAMLAAGGWGPRTGTSDDFTRIPNRNVSLVNNVFYNPAGYQSQWQHFEVNAPFSSTSQSYSHAPNPAKADDNLYIRGNVIWNGPTNHELGVEGSGGCANSNPTCNPTILRQYNTINAREPQFVNAAAGDFRPLPGGNISGYQTASIPAFLSEAPLSIPLGTLDTSVPVDRAGALRGATPVVGAYLP